MTTTVITDHSFDPGDHAWIEEDHLCHDCGKPRLAHAEPGLTTAEVDQHYAALHAENEALRLAAGKLDELITQLRQELAETEQALSTADIENERLRAALDGR